MVYDLAWNEFDVVKYKNKDGKILIQPKEELFKDGIPSPNVVDAAVLTQVISDSAIRSARVVRQNMGRPFHDQMEEVWSGGDKTIEKWNG